MKPKAKRKKKTPLQKIRALLDKLEALHEKEDGIVENIAYIIEEENEE